MGIIPRKTKYISLKEAAKRSGYAPDYIGYLIRKGKVEGKRVDAEISWRITPKGVIDYCNYCNPYKKIKNLNIRDSFLLKKKYISLKEAAEISGYSPDYIGYLIRKGKIKGKKFYTGISWLITEEAIKKYQEAKAQSQKKNLKLKKIQSKKKIPSNFPYPNLIIPQSSRGGNKIFGFKWRLAFTVLIALILQGSLILALTKDEPNRINFYPTVSDGGWENFQNAQGQPEVSPLGDINSFSEFNSAVYKTGPLSLVLQNFEPPEPTIQEPIIEEQLAEPEEEVCQHGTNRPCGTEVGDCLIGVQICENGIWGECIGGRGPTEEICDGVDNDCDGEIDEGGVCSAVQIEEPVIEELIQEEVIEEETTSTDEAIGEATSTFQELAESQSTSTETTTTDLENEPTSFFEGLRNLFGFATVKAEQNLTFEELNNTQFLSAKIKFSFAIGEKEPDVLLKIKGQQPEIGVSPEEQVGFWNKVKNFFRGFLVRETSIVRAEEENVTTSDIVTLDEEEIVGVTTTEATTTETIEVEPRSDEEIVMEATTTEATTTEEITELIIEEATTTDEVTTTTEEDVLPNLDARIIIWYSLDGIDWEILDTISEYPLSNFLNGGYFSYDASFLKNWEDVKNLKIKFEGVVGGETNVMAFLDSVWVEVSYEEKAPEEPEEYVLELISDGKDFKITEAPVFKFRYQKKRNLVEALGAEIANVFREEYENINIKVNVSGLDISPTVRYQGDGEFFVDLSEPLSQFRPGKYKLKIEIENNGQVLIQEQDFTWGVLAINVNKSIYLSDETAYIQMAVLRDDGHTICDANLALEIISPDGQISYPEIQESGRCGPNNVTNVPDYFVYYQVAGPSIYQMVLTNLDNGYEITDSFEVKKSVPFDVERIGPTRINPSSDYEMTLKIKANQDFMGEIVESIPEDFKILDCQECLKHDTKLIVWEVDWKAGESYELKYQFDAPDISPYLYLLGPLELTENSSPLFQEIRQWQIAADATARYFHETAASSDSTRQKASIDVPTTFAEDFNSANVADTETIFSNGADTDTWISDDLVGPATLPAGNWTFKAECWSTRTAGNFYLRFKVYNSSDIITPIFTTTDGTNCNYGSYTPKSWTYDPGEIILGSGDRLVYELYSYSDVKGGGGKRDYARWGDWTQADPDKTQVIDTYTAVAAVITVSGILYSDEGNTELGGGQTIAMKINGSAYYSTTTNLGASDGAWHIDNISQSDLFVSAPIIVYVTTTDQTVQAATITTASTTNQNITGLNLYKDRVIVKHEGDFNTTTTDITKMAQWDSDLDSEIQFDAEAGSLTVATTSKLYIWSDCEFAANGTITMVGNGGAQASPGGDLHIANGAKLTAGNNIMVAGNWIASSTSIFSAGSYSVTMTATTAGKEIWVPSANATFTDLIFDGTDGEWTFKTNATTTNNFTISAGTVIAPSGFLYIGNNYTNNGTFTHSNGTVLFNAGDSGNTLSGTMVDPSSFYNLTFNNADGSWSLSNNASTTNNLTITNGTLDLNGQDLEVAGNLDVSGTLDAITNTGTTTLSGAGKNLGGGGSATMYNLLIDGSITLAGVVDANNDFQITSGNSLDVSGSNHGITVGRSWLNSGTFTAQNGTTTFDGGSGGTITQGGSAFNHLKIDGTGSWSFQDVSATATDVTITSGTLNLSSADIFYVSGYWLVNGGTFTHNNKKVLFTATAAKNITAGNSDFYLLEFNGSSGQWTFQDAATSTATTTITLGTVVQSESNNLTLASLTIGTNGVFTDSSTGNLIFEGTDPVFIADNRASKATLGDVWIGYSPVVTNQKTDIVVDSFTVNVGDIHNTRGYEIDCATFVTVSGTLNAESSAAGETDGTVIYLGTNWTVTGVFTAEEPGSASTTVMFDESTGGFVAPGGTDEDHDFWNFIVNKSGPATIILSAAILVENDIEILTSDSELDVSGSNHGITVGGDWLNDGGTFTARNGTTTFDSGSLSKTITPGGSAFHNLAFNNSSGGWEIQGTSATSSNDFTIFDGNVTSTSGILYIGGNASTSNSAYFDHNSGTVEFYGTASTYLNTGCTDVDACTNADFYDVIINKTAGDANDNLTLEINHLRIRNTLTITDGELIQGDVGDNFNVRVEGLYTAGAAVTIESTPGKWTNHGKGDLILGGGFTNNGAVDFRTDNKDCGDIGWANDIYIHSTTTGVQTDWSGNNITMFHIQVKDQGGTATITVYDGESVSGNDTNWQFLICGINIAGILYSDEGGTPITDGGLTIALRVDGGGVYSTTTYTGGSGAWYINAVANVYPAAPIIVYVTTTDFSVYAATVTTASTTDGDITGLHLYQNRVIVRHEGDPGTTTTDITKMSQWDSDEDSEIQFDAEAGSLTVATTSKLYIWPSCEFDAGGTVTTAGDGANWVFPGGDLQISSGAVFRAGGNISVSGSWIASSTSIFDTGNYSVTMTATTTGKKLNIPSANATFTDLIFNGTNGGWTFETNATTTNNFTITNGTVTAPSGGIIYVGGDWLVESGGTFTHNSGTVLFNSTNPNKTITDGGSPFYNLTFNGSGSWLYQDATSTAPYQTTVQAGEATFLNARTGATSVTGSGILLVDWYLGTHLVNATDTSVYINTDSCYDIAISEKTASSTVWRYIDGIGWGSAFNSTTTGSGPNCNGNNGWNTATSTGGIKIREYRETATEINYYKYNLDIVWQNSWGEYDYYTDYGDKYLISSSTSGSGMNEVIGETWHRTASSTVNSHLCPDGESGDQCVNKAPTSGSWYVGMRPGLLFEIPSGFTVNFGTLDDTNNRTAKASSTLRVWTSATHGYVVTAWAINDAQLKLQGASIYIERYDVMNNAPEEWDEDCDSSQYPDCCGFGYTTSDSTLSGDGATRFTNGTGNACSGAVAEGVEAYAGFATTTPYGGDPVADWSTPTSTAETIITYKVSAPSVQAAGLYKTTVIYICTANY